MRWASRLFLIVAAIYLCLLGTLVLVQRRLMFFPQGPGGTAASYGLPDAQTLALKSGDGQTIAAWYQPPVAGKPLFLLFHGNGGTLSIRADLLKHLSDDGSGFLAIDYDGYGGSTGSPSEHAFLADGEAAYAEARALGYGPERIVIVGESIGTAVAVEVASRNPARALVLDAAFSSAMAIAEARYPIFPIALLMRDPFDSLSRIGKVAMPKLFLHGADDRVVPIGYDRKLFAAAPEPKTFVVVPGAGHVVLWRPGIIGVVRNWLATLPDPHSSFSTR